MDQSAWLAYGMRIPDTSSDRLEDVLSGLATRDQGEDYVGYLRAGRYDDERTYLVTRSFEADLGDGLKVQPETATAEQYSDWNHHLGEACRALGITEVPDASWLLIPHVS
ncbi:hypothetical protein ACWD25_15405 [Streptomyces sp. NPDC002920]